MGLPTRWTGKTKHFAVELQHLRECSEWTSAKAYYEGDQVLEVEDEFGRVWKLKELSIHDLQVIEKNLVLNLLADQLSGLEWRF